MKKSRVGLLLILSYGALMAWKQAREDWPRPSNRVAASPAVPSAPTWSVEFQSASKKMVQWNNDMTAKPHTYAHFQSVAKLDGELLESANVQLKYALDLRAADPAPVCKTQFIDLLQKAIVYTDIEREERDVLLDADLSTLKGTAKFETIFIPISGREDKAAAAMKTVNLSSCK